MNKTIVVAGIIALAFLSAVSFAQLLRIFENRDSQIFTGADTYAACVRKTYHMEAHEWYKEKGSYPYCNPDTNLANDPLGLR